MRKIGKMVLSGAGSVLIGHILCITLQFTGKTTIIIIWVLSFITGLVISFFTNKTMTMFITSFLGSYFIVRGITFYFGGFPNEIEILGEFTSHAVHW